jgi:hypothetical protein
MACKRVSEEKVLNGFLLSEYTVVILSVSNISSSQHCFVFILSTRMNQVKNLILGVHLDFHIILKIRCAWMLLNTCIQNFLD